MNYSRRFTQFVIFLFFLWGIQGRALGNSRIFFRMDRTLYAMNEDGQNIIKVLKAPLQPWMRGGFRWSPNGKQIVFSGDNPEDGSYDIFVMSADGKNMTDITNMPGCNHDPSWSPDGKQVAYVHEDADCKPSTGRIYVMNADGSGVFQLTDVDSSTPAWSPDGREIAFSFHPNSYTTHLYLVDVQTRERQPLQEDIQPILMMQWSPDGQKLAFSGHPEWWKFKGNQIYVVDVKSKAMKRLTSEGHNSFFSWSPDGSKIAFTSNRNNGLDIYVIDVESGTEKPTNTTGASVLGWYDFPLAVTRHGTQITLWGRLKQ